MAPSPTVKRLVAMLEKRACMVLLLFCAAAAVAAPFALQLSSTTVDIPPAAPGTRSKAEMDLLTKYFAEAFDDRETLYIKCVNPDAEDCLCILGSCRGFHRIVMTLQRGLAEHLADQSVRLLESVWDVAGLEGLEPIVASYYNATAKSMVATLHINAEAGEKASKDAVTDAMSLVEQINTDEPSFSVSITGRITAQLASSKTVGKAIGMADGTGTLLIVVLFGYRVGSWRLAMIPVVNTVICLLLAEAVCYPLAKSGHITVPSFVPNVCLFLCIALSVDYSFFHLARFQELRRQGVELVPAVEGMVSTAGRVVFVSGVVLLFTWLALACFPVFGIDALGYCASITIGSCILVNMALNSALIMAFPSFFSRAALDPCRCCRRRSQEQAAEARTAALPLATARGGEPPLPETEAIEEQNAYGKIAAFVTKMPGMIIVPLLVYAIFVPAAFALFEAKLSVGGVQGGTAATKEATRHILEDFLSTPSGAPYLVMLSPPAIPGLTSAEFFDASCDLAKSLQSAAQFPPEDVKGVMLSGRPGLTELQCVPWAAAKELLTSSALYAWSWRKATNSANTSTLLTLIPPFDAFSDEAKELVNSMRASLDSFMDAHPDWDVAGYHPMGVEIDAENLTAGRFPWVIGATVLIVFSVIGIRYKAALIPVKLLFTIVLPILFVLGCGVFVFQDGWLNWTRIPSLQSQGGLVWINPVACSFMLIGFALDYDLFLFSRIFEERKQGVFTDDRSAIVHSVAATGPVITTAGIIMAMAFSGMVVQHDNPFLAQMGFTMILGVLVDTFIVRTLLVPALLSMAGRLNWWPGSMPSASAPSSPWPAASSCQRSEENLRLR